MRRASPSPAAEERGRPAPRRGTRRSRTRTRRGARRGTVLRSASGRTSCRSARPGRAPTGPRARAGRAGAGSGCSRGRRRTGSRSAAGPRPACAVAGVDAVRLQAARSACAGRVDARPTIISVKKIPIENTCAEFWNVWFMRAAGAAVPGREAVHHRRAVGRGEHPHRDPHQQQDRRRTGGRRSRSAAARAARTRTRRATIPAVANGRAPKRSDR